MKTLLRIDASTRSNGSNSRTLGDVFETKWLEKNSNGKVIRRDLALEPIPHLNEDHVNSYNNTDSADSLSDQLISELISANDILICSPLYNFTLPSTLKSYFDQVVRSGKTFSFNKGQSKGLLHDKKATVITTRGSNSQRLVSDDFQTEYFLEIFKFIGINDINVIPVEGTAFGEEEKNKAILIAAKEVNNLFENPSPKWVGNFSIFEKQQISILRQKQALAIEQGNAQDYADCCTEDIQLMVPGFDIIEGKENLFDLEKKLFDKYRFASFIKEPITIEKIGDSVIEVGRQSVTMHNNIDNQGLLSSNQKYLHTYRLTNRQWLFSRLMSNPSE